VYKPDRFTQFMFLLVVFTLSRFHQHFPILVKIRALLLITILAGCYVYFSPKSVNLEGFKTWPAKTMFGLAFMACLSALLGISLGATGRFILEDYSKVLVLALLVMTGIRTVADLRFMSWAVVIAAGLLSYLSVFVFRMARGGAFDLARISGGYSYDANDIACVVVASLGFILLMTQTANHKGKLVALVVLAGCGMTLAKTGSRGGFVGLLGAGVALLVLLKGVSIVRKIGAVVVVAVSLSIIAPPGYWDQMATIFTPTKDYNWTAPTGRKAIAERGMKYMWSRPIAGIGAGNFGRAEGMISDRAVEWDPSKPGIKWSAPHNSYLEAAAEMGIPGGLLYIGLVFGTIFGLRRLNGRLPQRWMKGTRDERFLYYATVFIPVSMAGFAVSSFFVSFAYSDLVHIFAALAAGTYVCVQRQLGGQVAAEAPRPAKRPRGKTVRRVVQARPQMTPGSSWRGPHPHPIAPMSSAGHRHGR
jgi:O-antigen ligase